VDVLGIGVLRAIRRDPLALFGRLAGTPGGLFSTRIGPVRYVNVSAPGLIEQLLVGDARSYHKGLALERARIVLGNGLLTSEGETHRQQARLIAPAFSRRRILSFAPTVSALIDETTGAWVSGTTVDVAAEMTALTLRVVVATLLGSTIAREEADSVGQALTALLDDFEWLLTHPLGASRTRLRTPRVRRFLRARDVIGCTVERLVAERRSSGVVGDDVLSALVDGSPELLRDEAVTLLVAGHETTASWLTFAWLALAGNPRCEERLHAELDWAFRDAPITLEAVERLPYLAAVLEETLRLYPPAWGVGRRSTADTMLGERAIRAGTVVSACQHAMHRHPAHWSDPELFWPERWLEGERPARGVYFPFGDGPRRCIAEHFARAEALLAVAGIARRWRLVPTTDAPVALDARITLRVHGALPMRVERRS
jgi:cytochrome P450